MTKAIAYHLPQFHPIPENDAWWGAGFTEWRNVAKARSLFPGHEQPKLPGELGFYDLRLDETRERQAELARWANISGFCYYHYWFSGRLLLETPLELILSQKRPDFPFCLCWANHSWTGHWAGRSDDVIVAQTYPGEEDHRQHYEYLRRFFVDERYLTIDRKPVFVVFRPNDIPELGRFVEVFKTWALRDGFSGIHLIGVDSDMSLLNIGFDAIAPHSLNVALANYLTGFRRTYQVVRHKLLSYPRWVIDYERLNAFFQNALCDGVTTLPTVIPNWDNTARIGRRGLALTNATPDSFGKHLRRSIHFESAGGNSERIFFIKSWNEWAEGNYLEPDLRWGRDWLQALRAFLSELP